MSIVWLPCLIWVYERKMIKGHNVEFKSLERMLPPNSSTAPRGGEEKQGSQNVSVHEKKKPKSSQSACDSCSGSASVLAHERVFPLLDRCGLRLCGDHDGVLIYELTGGIVEGRQGQCDPLHLSLVHSLIVLLL